MSCRLSWPALTPNKPAWPDWASAASHLRSSLQEGVCTDRTDTARTQMRDIQAACDSLARFAAADDEQKKFSSIAARTHDVLLVCEMVATRTTS